MTDLMMITRSDWTGLNIIVVMIIKLMIRVESL